MKLTAIRPTKRLIYSLVAFVFVVIAAKLLLQGSEADSFSSSLLLALAVVALFDILQSRRSPTVECERILPVQMSFNRWHNVTIALTNTGTSPLQIVACDHLPDQLQQISKLESHRLSAKQKVSVNYQLKSMKRGQHEVGPLEAQVTSKFGFWQSFWTIDLMDNVKVYPDFRRLNSSESLNGLANLPIEGLKKLNKRGTGIEFQQLREFQHGDSIRQVDWHATSKRNKLISRQYQEEQNQHVTVMLDAGARMNIETKVGSHFDAALNALLMLGHTVLKQGDWFSMQSFNLTERWLPAVKGAQNVSMIMNHFYDLQPDESASDYSMAVNQLLTKRSKRALVLMVTSLHDQGFEDLLPALKRLQQHHLVALVAIENVAVNQAIEADIKDVGNGERYCAALELKNLYERNVQRLVKEGIICVHSKPEHLLPYMINTYLNVKHSGML